VGENRVSTFEEGISEWNWSKKVMLFILKNWWILFVIFSIDARKV
jgi:hypothetical protein